MEIRHSSEDERRKARFTRVIQELANLGAVWSLEPQDGSPLLVDTTADGKVRDEKELFREQRARLQRLDEYFESDENLLSALKLGRTRLKNGEHQG